MTSIEYWQKLVAEYPSLADDKTRVTLEVSWLHTKMTLAHAEGCKYTKERLETDRHLADSAESILGSMFGGK